MVDANEKVQTILENAKNHPNPVTEGELNQHYKEFFEAMANVWKVADTYKLTDDIDFTTFLMFGPQSAGKTTLTERILGFPIGTVKRGIGTTRPMVLTTRCSMQESFKVKGPNKNSVYLPKPKEDIMQWVDQQMQNTGNVNGRPRITSERIYVEASGPMYKNRRFVDLPGFQANDDASKGTREDILNLLRNEVKNESTVVVCVEDAVPDFEISNLLPALKLVFPDTFGDQAKSKALSKQFVFALNKSDAWLERGGVGPNGFVDKIYGHLKGSGLVPILVGASVDASNRSLRDKEEGGRVDCFSELEREYKDASERETILHRTIFDEEIKLDPELEACLSEKFRGFATLLHTVDALTIKKDRKKLETIYSQLQHSLSETENTITELQQKRDQLIGPDGNPQYLKNKASNFIRRLFNDLTEIATTDFGRASASVAADVEAIKKHGNTALMEELEFLFGTDAKSLGCVDYTKKGGYYQQLRSYEVSDASLATVPEKEYIRKWNSEVQNTIRLLEGNNGKALSSIAYINKKLVNGALYERSIAVWSTAVYRLVVPTQDDLEYSLPNTTGSNPEMFSPSSGVNFQKAKRLAETYIGRMPPAVNFLCQKMEFILLKMFDTAWRSVLKTPQYKVFVEAVGNKLFMSEMRERFKQKIQQRAAMTYDRCFFDLHNEVQSCSPIPKTVRQWRDEYLNGTKQNTQFLISSNFSTGYSSTFLKGLIQGIELIAKVSSIDPLLFVGLKIVMPLIKLAFSGKKEGMSRADDRDEHLLGFAACLYSHFLPKFITTIDGRMRSDMLAYVKDPELVGWMESWVEESTLLKRLTETVAEYESKIKGSEQKKADISNACKSLIKAKANFPDQTDDLSDEALIEPRVAMPPIARTSDDIVSTRPSDLQNDADIKITSTNRESSLQTALRDESAAPENKNVAQKKGIEAPENENSDWVPKFDSHTEKFNYYNTNTGESVWDLPRSASLVQTTALD